MKKLLLLLLGALISLPAFARFVEYFDYTYEGQTLTYCISSDDTTCFVSGYTNVVGKVEIPRIAKNISDNKSYIVTDIGPSAFHHCNGLTSIIIPEFVRTIAPDAFSDCSNLTSVTFHNSVTAIYESAFYGCSSLTSINIPNSVTFIGRLAFGDCGLTSVTIPNSVTTIEEVAFFDCSDLTSVNIGESVSDLGAGAFSYCTSLKAITVAAGNSHYTSVDGVVYSKNMSQLVQYPAGKEEAEFAIPNSVTEIAEMAFEGCIGLTSITIGNSVKSIGTEAFYGCDNLTSVEILNPVEIIGDLAFSYCSGLSSAVIGNSVSTIGGCAFEHCGALTSVTIPNSVKSIGEYAFSYCGGLTSVIIPPSVKSLNSYAFYGCSHMIKFACPNTLGNLLCYGTRIAYNPEEAIVEDGWIYGPDKKEIIFAPLNLEGEYAISETVEAIGRYAFYRCSNLTSVIIPNSVTTIGAYAFYDCSNLTSVIIGNSVNAIGEEAFSNRHGSAWVRDITYLANEPLECSESIFNSAIYYHATLNYLKSAEEKIATTVPWCLFADRIGRDADSDVSITEVYDSGNENAAVYDMRGVKVGDSLDGLPHGIYIIRQGSKTTKCAI